MRTTIIIAYAGMASVEDALSYGTRVLDMYPVKNDRGERQTAIEIEDDEYLIYEVEAALDAAYIEFSYD